MKVFYFFVLFLFSFSFADELFLYREKPANYVQYEEFLVADGVSVIGPVKLLPHASLDSLKVETGSESIKILAVLVENTGKNWKNNIIDKHISVEGQGRFIRGKVKSIEGNFIIIDTNRGTVITTLPDFPERISSLLRWEELFSPYVMVKINSSFSGNSTFRFVYQIDGITWEPVYLYKKDKEFVEEFIKIENKTNINFQNVKLYIKYKDKTFKEFETSIESNSKKLIKTGEYTVKNGIINTENKLIDGKVAVYDRDEFLGFRILKKNIIK